MTLLDTLLPIFTPLIYITVIGTIGFFILRAWFKHRLKVSNINKKKIANNEEEELKNWIITAIQNPGIAIKEVEKEIQQHEINGEKGWPFQFAMMKKQALEFAQANPMIAQKFGPKIVEKGFKLYKKIPSLIGGLGL